MQPRLENICGNSHVKRAMEVALAGAHTILIIGSPSSQAWGLASIVNRLHPKLDEIEDSCQEIWSNLAEAVSPCPCGYYGDPDAPNACTCSLEEISTWRRETFPVAPRDITIRVVRPDTNRILRWAMNDYKDGEPEQEFFRRVAECRANYRRLDSASETAWALLRAAITKKRLSPRAVRQVVRVANTIASMEVARQIEASHMAEAIQYMPSEGELR